MEMKMKWWLRDEVQVVFAGIILCVMIAVGILQYQHTRVGFAEVGKYHVTYYVRYGQLDLKPDLLELVRNPAIVEVSWRERADGSCRWFDWYRGDRNSFFLNRIFKTKRVSHWEGGDFIHNGTPVKC